MVVGGAGEDPTATVVGHQFFFGNIISLNSMKTRPGA